MVKAKLAIDANHSNATEAQATNEKTAASIFSIVFQAGDKFVTRPRQPRHL
jgi:hypothetical protein